jgi:hypothetical protein
MLISGDIYSPSDSNEEQQYLVAKHTEMICELIDSARRYNRRLDVVSTAVLEAMGTLRAYAEQQVEQCRTSWIAEQGIDRAIVALHTRLTPVAGHSTSSVEAILDEIRHNMSHIQRRAAHTDSDL